MNQVKNPADSAKQQPEPPPFPARNPEDESRRLVVTGLDMLGKISHFCFGGNLDLAQPFHALVAGGGTGDATIFLAEQLRSNPVATVTHLDVSSAAIDIAKRRAEKRGLANIQWVHGSILNLKAASSFGVFDYINCAGVLDHMSNPSMGLRRLKSVLAETGCMGIMVYGRYGRASVYEVQALLKVMGIDSARRKLHHTRSVLQSLSPMHSHVRGWPGGPPTGSMDDANIFDAYLRTEDRAYTVPELYDLVEKEGLQIAAFGDFDPSQPVMRIEYDPATYVADEELLASLKKLPARDQHAAAELLNGVMSLHSIYVTARPAAPASFAAPGNIPFFHDSKAIEMAEAFIARPSNLVELRCKKTVKVELSLPMRKFLAQVGGQKTTGQILVSLLDGKGPDPAKKLLAQLLPEFELLNSLNVLFLRGRKTQHFSFVSHSPIE